LRDDPAAIGIVGAAGRPTGFSPSRAVWCRRRPAGRAAIANARRALDDWGLLALYGVGVFTVVFITVGFRMAGSSFHVGPAPRVCSSSSIRSGRSTRPSPGVSPSGSVGARRAGRQCRSR
jgi:hypothetical protein